MADTNVKGHASLGRLRYWLPLFQAPRYGTGFIASEGRGAPQWAKPTQEAVGTE